MRNPLQAYLEIVVAPMTVTFSGRRSWRQGREAILTTRDWYASLATTDMAHAVLSAALSAYRCSHKQTRVIIADALVRYFMVTPATNTVRLADCRAAVAMRFQSLYGQSTNGWQVQALWHPSRPFLACAVPDTILHAIRRLSEEHHLTLTSILPSFVSSWNQWAGHLNGDAWFGNVIDRTLCLGVIAHQRLNAVLTTPISTVVSADWLSTHLEREALHLNLPAPRNIQCCGEVPLIWLKPTPGAPSCVHLDSAYPVKARPSPVSSVLPMPIKDVGKP